MNSPTPDNQAPEAEHPRRIKSFVRRTGRTTVGQNKALEELGPQFILQYKPQLLQPAEVFAPLSGSPLVLEIGFGMGEATAKIAQTLSASHFIACEVHPPGVGALLKRIAENNIQNIRIFQHDAVEVVDHMLETNSLDGVHIFFPDPWHKKRHNKRRLIQAPFVAKLCAKLKPGGYIHVATDWQPYAEQVLEVLKEETQLQNTSQHANGFADKPSYRPLTKFENRGIKLGHGVWDLVFSKI